MGYKSPACWESILTKCIKGLMLKAWRIHMTQCLLLYNISSIFITHRYFLIQMKIWRKCISRPGASCICFLSKETCYSSVLMLDLVPTSHRNNSAQWFGRTHCFRSIPDLYLSSSYLYDQCYGLVLDWAEFVPRFSPKQQQSGWISITKPSAYLRGVSRPYRHPDLLKDPIRNAPFGCDVSHWHVTAVIIEPV